MDLARSSLSCVIKANKVSFVKSLQTNATLSVRRRTVPSECTATFRYIEMSERFEGNDFPGDLQVRSMEAGAKGLSNHLMSRSKDCIGIYLVAAAVNHANLPPAVLWFDGREYFDSWMRYAKGEMGNLQTIISSIRNVGQANA